MHSTEGTSSNFIFDYVLIDMVFCFAILFIIRVFGVCIERFLNGTVLRGRATVMSKRTLVGGGGALDVSPSPHQARFATQHTDAGL